MTFQESTRLADVGLRYPNEVFSDVFLIAPATLQADPPDTVADLALAAHLRVEETVALLEKIVAEEHEIEITPAELQSLQRSSESLILLDVREPWEFEICSIPESRLLTPENFMAWLPEMQSAKRIVTICHHGVRSYSAAMYLRQEGLVQTQSLAGGVARWAEEVDPQMARY